MKYVIESAFENMSIQKIMQLGLDANGRITNWTDSIEDVEELNSDYINEHYGGLQDDAYKRGYEDGKDSVVNGCDGCRYKSKQESGRHPCFACARYYKDDYYEPIQKDEITVGVHFGDEIVVNGERGVIVSHENEGSDTIWALLNGYRTPQIVDKNNYTKTGRRFGIEEIMEAMRK